MAQFQNFSREKLQVFVERIEQLEEEKKSLTEDIQEVFSEAKTAGFDIKVLRQIIRLRRMDEIDRSEMEATLLIYKQALEM